MPHSEARRTAKWREAAPIMHEVSQWTGSTAKEARRRGDKATETMVYNINKAFRADVKVALQDRDRQRSLMPIEDA